MTDSFEIWYDKEYPLPATFERGPIGRDHKKGCRSAYELGQAENNHLKVIIGNLKEEVIAEHYAPEKVSPYTLLEAENKCLRRLCREIQSFFEGIGTVLDADQIRKAYNDSTTKAEIEQALKG